MTALRAALLACRVAALVVALWAVIAGWRPMLDILTTHEVRVPLHPPANRWI